MKISPHKHDKHDSLGKYVYWTWHGPIKNWNTHDRVEPMEGGKEGWELMSPLCIFEQRWGARAKHSLSGTIIPISNLTSN